ncbi:hypothetical protein [Micromonospora tulbaghiae]|uniref:hypothetical protein n=1 Tax=Micromonospora tulbaghiae TaxID=479978 RepID=UPI0033C2D220
MNSTTKRPLAIDETLTYTTPNCRVTVTIQRIRHDVYTVTTVQGGLRVDANSGSYSDEQTARLVARGYAEMYRAENLADEANPLAVLAGLGRHRQVRPTMAGAHLAKPSEAAMRILRQAAEQGGTVDRSKTATIVQLKALARKGLVSLNYAPGTAARKLIVSATLTDAGRKQVA